MKIAVRYYTKTGNTRKLADAIAGAVGVEAKAVNEKLTSDVDILFLGSSVYAAGVDVQVKKFIEDIDVPVGKIVNFSTAAVIKSTYSQIKKLAGKRGISVSDKEYHCRGSFGPIHRGKPDADDLNKASQFAKSFL
ncbi:flavodoxin family protein [Clostridium luticellarii]|jgi:flavodoxin|uniref:Flavodoxin n=1 Tax=Clostridium luticellarii TaxID=1691940 RepID=A0A2T0BJB4_9CLOT|nr:flavodoxin family protein [Clostridium luticellarii]MCI1944060.1 flavodoxin [Clostridium luticellarii]MCI1967298.1 flavodoxin [Clostridium luticellarii]MCI1995209.1 flavodoxin [Clostridium luticellarii]MCI2039295.1 flavodoxin [Clostridium luticellarii]PRR83988.1 flavodoxin [Clostridium luticellarii]